MAATTKGRAGPDSAPATRPHEHNCEVCGFVLDPRAGDQVRLTPFGEALLYLHQAGVKHPLSVAKRLRARGRS